MTTYTTLNPADKSATITLSGGDLVATSDGSGTSGNVRAVLFASTATSTDKLYAEATIGAVSGNTWIGLGTSAANLAAYVGSDVEGYGWLRASASQYHSGASSGSGTYTTGDVIGILFDPAAGTMSWTKNGTPTGTAYTSLSGSFAVMVGGNTSSDVTLNFGASAWNNLPEGYGGWVVPSNDIAVTAPAPTLVTGFDGINKSAPTARLVTGFDGVNQSAPAPTLVAAITINGGALTAPAPTLVATGLPGRIGTVAASAPVPTTVAVLTPSTTYGVNVEAPAPTLSSSSIVGSVGVVAITAPKPTLEFGMKDARLTAPAPSLVASVTGGMVITVAARSVAPLLSAVADNPAIITAAGSAALPRLSAALAAGNIATAILEARKPSITSTGFTGTTISVIATAATPIMAAAGYPAYTITAALTAPAARLVAEILPVIASTYRTWVLNTKKGALTEYTNFEFNSYAVFNGVVLGCGSSGVVALGTQALDNATAIASTVKSGQDNFGSSVIKRLPRIYLDYTTGGDAQFKLITTEGGSRTYALNWNGVTGAQTRRIPVGKGPKSSRWQWEYTNVSGADFDLGAVLAYPQKLRRRVQ